MPDDISNIRHLCVQREPRSKLNLIFFLICLNISGWLSFYIPFNLDLTENALTLWFKISYCFISFLPIMCFYFCDHFSKHTPQQVLVSKLIRSLGFFLSILSIFSNLIVGGVNHLKYGNYPYPKAGLAHPLLVLHCFCLAFYSLRLIYLELKNPGLPPKEPINLNIFLFRSLY